MHMKINVAIIEDEEKERDITKEMLERFFKEENVPFELSFFSCGNDFFESNINEYNFLLLDIILPGDNGVSIAKEAREKGWPYPLMFITKTIQFALDGYKVDALDYLLKPIVYDDFRLKLLKAVKIIENFKDKEIAIRTASGLVVIKESEIYYIEVNKHYLTFHTEKGEFVTRGSMNSISQEVSKRFANSSNSFLINLDKIELIKQNEVVVNKENLPLSRSCKKEFLHCFEDRKG